MPAMLNRGSFDTRQFPPARDQADAQIKFFEGMEIAVGEIVQFTQRAHPVKAAAIQPVHIAGAALLLGLVIAGAGLELDALDIDLDNLAAHPRMAG
jgi:hypothetical protein